MSRYLTAWLIIFIIVGYEYYALNFSPGSSLLLALQNKGYINESLEISAQPGRRVSLWLGWVGLGLMIVMNLYSMRKRLDFMKNLGKLSSWLNFHIFCGLLGPTLILFHCNFKVRGLVGISFWSMVVSFSSGIIGRYFYVQMLRERSHLDEDAKKTEEKLKSFLVKSVQNFNEQSFTEAKHKALVVAGLPNGLQTELNPFSALYYSVLGDLKLAFVQLKIDLSWPTGTRYLLESYAVNVRRALFLSAFQKLMGYWHTFHFPFAIFMYVVAVIHVAAALVLGV
jgi:hypothetical protein